MQRQLVGVASTYTPIADEYSEEFEPNDFQRTYYGVPSREDLNVVYRESDPESEIDDSEIDPKLIQDSERQEHYRKRKRQWELEQKYWEAAKEHYDHQKFAYEHPRKFTVNETHFSVWVKEQLERLDAGLHSEIDQSGKIVGLTTAKPYIQFVEHHEQEVDDVLRLNFEQKLTESNSEAAPPGENVLQRKARENRERRERLQAEKASGIKAKRYLLQHRLKARRLTRMILNK